MENCPPPPAGYPQADGALRVLRAAVQARPPLVAQCEGRHF
jgi:hypothetical protein